LTASSFSGGRKTALPRLAPPSPPPSPPPPLPLALGEHVLTGGTPSLTVPHADRGGSSRRSSRPACHDRRRASAPPIIVRRSASPDRMTFPRGGARLRFSWVSLSNRLTIACLVKPLSTTINLTHTCTHIHSTYSI
jgi:hypothetical protein